MYLPIIQTIAEDRVRELQQAAQESRDARLARQRSARLRHGGEAPAPAVLRLVPARIRPHFA